MAVQRKKNTPGKSTQKAMSLLYMAILVTSLLLGFFSWPILMLASLGLVPSWAMLQLDRSKENIGFLSVLIPNLMGVLFVCILFLNAKAGSNNWGALVSHLSKPATWMAMYIPGCLAIFVHTQLSELIFQNTLFKSRKRVEELKKKQEEILDNWGASIKE